MRERTLKVTITGIKPPKSVREALHILGLKYADLHKRLKDDGHRQGVIDCDQHPWRFRLAFQKIDPNENKPRLRLRRISGSNLEPVILSKDETIYTPAELADFLRVSKFTIMEWIYSNRLRAFSLGNEWRITGPAVNEFVNENQRKMLDAIDAEKEKPEDGE
jgi:excisionase family DNA binding protein